MNVWRLKTHHLYPSAAMKWTRENERIAIGWGAIGDLHAHAPASYEEITELVRAAYPGVGNYTYGGKSLWNLFEVMTPGDLVVLSGEKTRERVVEVVGDYEYIQDPPDFYRAGAEGLYQHQRRVRLTALDPEDIYRRAGGCLAPNQSVYQTLVRYARPLDGLAEDDAVTTPLVAVPHSAGTGGSAQVALAAKGRSGRNNKLTGQIGEFLVCAELGRRGFIATPFSGNVPAFDVIAADEFCRTVPIQVKASTGDNWNADSRRWLSVKYNEETQTQHVLGVAELDNPDIIYVCVAIAAAGSGGRDRFFVLTQKELQAAIYEQHSAWLEARGGRRPRSPLSTDARYRIEHIAKYEDNWGLITERLKESAPDVALGTEDS